MINTPLAERQLLRRIRVLTGLFMLGLVLSGITAFPLEWELDLLCRWMGVPGSADAAAFTGLAHWLVLVRNGLHETYAHYPFIAYGTDWLAFAHIVIAIAFIGVLRDPVRNVWVVQWGMIACVLIIPVVLICGPLRGIPPYWQVIDCSFGIVGFPPLWIVWRWIRELETMREREAPAEP